ncbi:YhdP family protein [Paracraurococcus lichenis]|uniref:DUF3971 domain-containing protein n=1 Tax=Paracraurococcus lichenis TaxID=3064888 RepID=A0ABT9E7L3_9PROT|nr:DUF3971 domain-containing protein [Paracraurococcus sp. LOR1-02]MDO9711945.1 DUF3971 domain-containing protein [Paracraurococcus sp. LOR1-02]
MTAAPGQALAGPGWRWVHRCAATMVFLVVALLLGLGVMAWRLAERPLELPQLARQIEAAVNARPDGLRLAIGHAAIAWEGFRGGTAAPLDIRLRDVRLLAGSTQAELPEAALTLSVRALLRGVVAPATIELRRPRLHATLTEGGIALGLAPAAEGDAKGEVQGEAQGQVGPATDPAALLAGLMQPASDRDAFAALRRIRVNGGEAVLADPAAGLTWTLQEPHLDLRRDASGGLAGEGEAVLRAGAVSVPVRLAGRAEGTPMRLALGLDLPALRPPQLAAIWPPLAPLAALDAPVTLSARAEFDAAARPDRMEARLLAGAGSLVLAPGQRLPFAGLEAVAEGNSRALTIREAVLRLPGQGVAPGPALTARGEVTGREGEWQARLDLGAGPLQLGDLPRLWPEALAPAARAAALRAMPSGLLREARARLDLVVPAGLDAVSLRAARLGLTSGPVALDVAGSRVVAAGVELAASYAPDAVRLERIAVRLPATGNPSGPAPTLAAEGEALLRDGTWRIGAQASLDAVGAADLAAYWPAGLGKGARDWVTRNITAGRIRNGQWRLEAEAPAALDGLRLTGLTGSAEIADATVHWLRPVPPAEGASGTVEFGLSEVTIRGRASRQMLAEGKPSGIEVKEATARFFNLETEPGNVEMAFQLAGPLPDVFAVLRQPRLKLFDRRKLEAQAAAGQAEARLTVGFPLWEDLPIEALKIRATGKVTEARLPGALVDRDVERGNFDLAVDTEGLKLSGQAQWLGAPVRLGLEMDFRAGPSAQVTERGTLTGRLEARQAAALGLDTGRMLDGPAALEARYERRRNGQGSVALRADLRDARLAVEALNWAKPAGSPGMAEATLRLQGEALVAAEGLRLEAQDLSLRGRAGFGPRTRLDRMELSEGAFGASRFAGEVRRPEREGGAWQASLRGPLLDLQPVLGPPTPGAARDPAPPEEDATPLQLVLDFDRVTNGEGRTLFDAHARLRTDRRGLLREAWARGRTGAAPGQGAFDFSLVPQETHRLLRLTAEDGGALLHALDLADAIRGGRLVVNARYAELRPGAPLAGTAELDGFVLRDAPAAAKLLQAMTLYGLVEAVQGGKGLVFGRLVAPFTLSQQALTLSDARAFSASLGVTAKGRILRDSRTAEVEGTIVPAYMFNTLLGNLPVLGRLFSPEAGGGVFAATYAVRGPLDDPQVTVNPLAALTPGFLRGLFGLGGPREPAR